MGRVGILDIQENLKKTDKVSVPWIQSEYNLNYGEARLFIDQLIIRGWVKNAPYGMWYEVIKENLRLRRIDRTEVTGLIEDMDMDCSQSLDYIHKKSPEGVDINELANNTYGASNARHAIEVLGEHNLIYCFNDKYFSCVSKDTIGVISEVVKVKRSNELNRRFATKKGDKVKPDDIKEIAKLFDRLFE